MMKEKGQGIAAKKGWEIKMIGEVCQIRPPKSEARDRLSDDALVSFLPMEDMGIGVKFVQGTQVRPLSTVQGSYTYFADGDVLLAKITPCFENGKLGIAQGLSNGIGFGSSEYFVFRPQRTLIGEWLYYCLAGETFRAEGAVQMTGAVGHKRVAKEFIENYLIPVPPMGEQERIVGILDEAFEGIARAKANAEKNLQNARAIFDSHLHSVFSQRGKGWRRTTLGEVCKFRSGGTPSKSVQRYWRGNIPWVSPKDMKTEIIFDSIDHISREAIDASSTSLIPKDSVLIVVRSGILARIVPIAITGRDITINQDLKALCPDETIDARFLYHLLGSKMDDLLSMVTRGATVHRLMTDQIRRVDFTLPPMGEQERIVGILDGLATETQRLAGIYERKLVLLEELKKALLHRAFSGEL